MADPRFFQLAGPFRADELARVTGTTLVEGGDPARMLYDVAPLDQAEASHLSFFTHRRYGESFSRSRAGAVFTTPGAVSLAPPGMTLLVTDNPYLAFARAARLFHPEPPVVPGIAATAVVEAESVLDEDVSVGHHTVIGRGARIGAGTSIGANAVIGDRVVIGTACRIGPNVTISHAVIGNRVTILPGARIGQDGFGFASDAAGHVKIPQTGRVLIGDDVEIGANATIDRGAGPDTVIGAGSMIDNLVQIGHNVVLGRGCVLVAQTGIAGSTRLGDFVVTGGQAGLAGHLTIGAKAKIGAKAGVMRDIPPDAVMGGSPAVPMMQWLRQTALLDRLANKKEKG